jgi:hypothetical protein
MEVLAYYTPTLFDSWYVYPLNEDNLYAVLDENKSTQGKSELAIEKLSGEPKMLMPTVGVKSESKFNPNAKKLAPTGVK